jgi:uncharacterized protein with NRDE domain
MRFLSLRNPAGDRRSKRMCLAVVAIRAHPRYPLVIAANRDEFHARPTQPAHWWDEGWLAGRDLAAGGTWLGVTRAGRWALLTNVREPARHDPAAPSRGALVTTVLAAPQDAGSAVATTIASATRHNGFNLLAGDGEVAHWGSNRATRPARLASGIHGLSNHLLDTPWPKVSATKSAMAAWCASADAGDRAIESLFATLGDRSTAPDAMLPPTGLLLPRERLVSAPFIVSEDYGTRSSTVMTLDADGNARFVERSFDPAGNAAGEVEIRFRINQPTA